MKPLPFLSLNLNEPWNVWVWILFMIINKLCIGLLDFKRVLVHKIIQGSRVARPKVVRRFSGFSLVHRESRSLVINCVVCFSDLFLGLLLIKFLGRNTKLRLVLRNRNKRWQWFRTFHLFLIILKIYRKFEIWIFKKWPLNLGISFAFKSLNRIWALHSRLYWAFMVPWSSQDTGVL